MRRTPIIRRPPSWLPIFIGSCSRGVGWRHAFTASMWSLFSAVFCSAARVGDHRPCAVSLVVNNSRRKCLDSSPHATQVSLDVSNNRLFLRRGRTTRNSGDAQRETEAHGDVQLDVTNETDVTGNCALRAFDRWAEKTGACSASEFMQGVHQSYYGIGVLCETLSEAARPQLPLGKVIPLAGALEQLKSLLANHYAVRSTSLSNEVEVLREKSVKGGGGGKDGRRTAKAVAEALAQVLPISLELGESMYKMWNKQRMFESNVLRIAASNDYILSTNMVFFYECNNIKDTHFSKDIPLTVIAAPSLCDAKEKGVKSSDANSNSQATSVVKESKLTADSQLSEKEKKKDTVSTDKSEGATEAVRGETIITFKGRTLLSIPASAVACVVASVDVVTPPQRYDPNFDWYYHRITGYESEYQRIAIARVFAMSNAQVFLAPLDFLIRMFTGHHLELACPPGISDLMDIPKNIAECPPAMRKLLCYYLDADGRWVLSNLFWLDSVTTPLVVEAAPA